MRVKTLRSCWTLYDPMDRSLPGSSVHGILQARLLEGLPYPLLEALLDPGIELHSLMSLALGDRFFTTSTTWEAQRSHREHLKHSDAWALFPETII